MKLLLTIRGRARRRNFIIAGVVVFVLIIATLAWLYRNYPEERVVQKFFTALQNKDYEKAFALWQADPNWKQHPQNPNYTFGDFYQDWGPGGEWGLIHSFHIDGFRDSERWRQWRGGGGYRERSQGKEGTHVGGE